jgi:hypothetical protein
MDTDAVPPDERRRYRRLGAALLTDDGRVTDARRAEAIAVEALAGRMRSSTPELVLAAMGLVVSSEMVDRLGDSRYVLLPDDARYPAAGAQVLHTDELRSAAYRSHAHRAVCMDTAEAERLVRLIATGELMGAWTYGSSNNARVFALQAIARDEFGLRHVVDAQLDRETRRSVELELRYNRSALADFLRTQYTMTQEVLRARGITGLISYRAHIWSRDGKRPAWAAEDSAGQVVEVPQRPLASWSPDRQVIADWLAARQEPGVILAARHPAEDVVALPTTGMGSVGEKRWVLLPGNRRAVVDVVVADPRLEHASGIDRSAGSRGPTRKVPEVVVGGGWDPRTVAARVRAADALDVRIGRILDGREEAPAWWLRDDSGYAVAGRDLEFLRIDEQHVRWMLTGQSPMGLTPKLYHQFAGELLHALQQDRVGATQVDVRLKGTAAEFFSGVRKTLPTEAELADRPEALGRMREWFGDDQRRPLRRPYDAMYRLGLEPEPSDYDLDINSTAAIRVARTYWREHHRDRYPGDFMGGHGYLDKQAVRGALPHLADWATRWEDKLSRPLSLGVFESTGPFNEAALGRNLSAHFKPTDWLIHHTRTSAGPQLPPSDGLAPTPTAARSQHPRRVRGLRADRVGGRA